ncbi:MAG: 2-phospho-L-lactate guanylyltransferase [Euryarchaeota archaeon]|nr:2-phospho-L-lactate guanylyltransferase [Euryarchaeota archaeon]
MTEALVPFKPRNPKGRLSPVLTLGEREDLAWAMLRDAVGACRGAGLRPVTVLLSHPSPRARGVEGRGVRVVVEPGALNPVVNRRLRGARGPVVVVMPDLPLLTPGLLRDLAGSREEVALAPGRRGGTSLLLVRRPGGFRADYYRGSFRKHLGQAQRRGLSTRVMDSFYASVDVDEPEDLLEVLLHGGGESRRVLEGMGFRVGVRGHHPFVSRAHRAR